MFLPRCGSWLNRIESEVGRAAAPRVERDRPPQSRRAERSHRRLHALGQRPRVYCLPEADRYNCASGHFETGQIMLPTNSGTMGLPARGGIAHRRNATKLRQSALAMPRYARQTRRLSHLAGTRSGWTYGVRDAEEYLLEIGYRRRPDEQRATATMTSSTVADISTRLIPDSAHARDRDGTLLRRHPCRRPRVCGRGPDRRCRQPPSWTPHLRSTRSSPRRALLEGPTALSLPAEFDCYPVDADETLGHGDHVSSVMKRRRGSSRAPPALGL